jgi:hypothetical protein
VTTAHLLLGVALAISAALAAALAIIACTETQAAIMSDSEPTP